MKTKLSLATAAVIAMLSNAQALEIGDVINTFTPPVAGCTMFADAREANRQRTLYGLWASQRYVEEIASYNSSARHCMMLAGDGVRFFFKVMQRQPGWPGTSNRYAWFCLEAIDLFADGVRGTPRTNAPCYWTYLLDRPTRPTTGEQ